VVSQSTHFTLSESIRNRAGNGGSLARGLSMMLPLLEKWVKQNKPFVPLLEQLPERPGPSILSGNSGFSD
jgi:hypothetical protein